MDPFARFDVEVLSNGLTVYSTYWPDCPWQVMSFLVHSGANMDAPGLDGTAHFVEHLVSQNASCSKEELREFFDLSGGEVHLGVTGYRSTKYGFLVPLKVLPSALDIFGTMLITAKLENGIDKERQVILGEFRRSYPLEFHLELALRQKKMVYSGHKLENYLRPLGIPESIELISEKDVQAYHDAHYTPANMSVICVGGKNIGELVKLINESSFALKKPGERTPFSTRIKEFDPLPENEYAFNSPLLKTITYRTVSKFPGGTNVSAVILQQILQKIFLESIREHHAWAYHVSVERYDLGMFQNLSICCRGLSPKAIDKIEGVVTDSINSLNDRSDLFKKVQKKIVAHNLMSDLNGRSICGIATDDLVAYNRIISQSEHSEMIQSVTFAEIQELIEKLAPQYRWSCIIAPPTE